MNRKLACAALCTISLIGLSGSVLASDVYVPGDFDSIQDAIDASSVLAGDTIHVGPGDFAGALVNKEVAIKGIGNARITSGPLHGSGMSQGFRLLTDSDGSTFSHLTFTTDLSIMNADAVDDVTVTQCTFLNSVQAISNWRGRRWEITHNTITDLRTNCGGGIGILIADFDARAGGITDNVVSHNTITGQLNVSVGDCGGYSGSGIVLYADFRGGRLGAANISGNRVVKNKVDMVSSNPTLVDIVAFEMTDTRDLPGTLIIKDNAIGFNDFRGTTLQIALTPEELGTVNDISRNFGDNRGQGSHPGVFGPGGN